MVVSGPGQPSFFFTKSRKNFDLIHHFAYRLRSLFFDLFVKIVHPIGDLFDHFGIRRGVVFHRRLELRMTGELPGQREGIALQNPARDRRAPEIVKMKIVDPGDPFRRGKGPFEVGKRENPFAGRKLSDPLELVFRSLGKRRDPLALGFGVSAENPDLVIFRIDILPAEFEDLAAAHPGIERQQNDGFQMRIIDLNGRRDFLFFALPFSDICHRALALAGIEKPSLFVERQKPGPLYFVRFIDNFRVKENIF